MSREYEYDNQTDYNPMNDKFTKVGESRQGPAQYGPAYADAFIKNEEARSAQVRSEKQENDLNREAKYARMDYERDQERTQARADMLRKQEEAKADAIDLARERYLEKSGLYRLFHKRLSDKKAAKMTTAEINNLYGGIEEEKGRSR